MAGVNKRRHNIYGKISHHMTPESKHFMTGLLMAAVLIAGIAVELVLVARWFKWPY